MQYRPENPTAAFGPVLTVVNSTISGNSTEIMMTKMAPDGIESGSGGGIFASFGSVVNLLNATITNNSTPGRTGAGIRLDNLDEKPADDGLVVSRSRTEGETMGSVRNTIIAANGDAIDVRGAFFSTGYNLIGNVGEATGFDATGDQVGNPDVPIDPLLDPLDTNGGPTLTHELLPGSPAIDKGGSAPELDTDQRGGDFPRVIDGPIPNADEGNGSDIGAFEVQTLPPTPTPTPVPGRLITIDSVTRTEGNAGNDGIHLQCPGQPTASAGVPGDGAVRDG